MADVTPAGIVVGRITCGSCFDDHYVIVCVACGRSFDHYIGGTVKCECGADVTPTEEQHERWDQYEFDELCDQHDDCRKNVALALACWKSRAAAQP